MGRYTFRLPDIGEGIAEAEIVAWHIEIGQRVEEDSPIADMMTDKATVEMESPVTGKVLELAGKPGDMIPIGSPLVVIETDGGDESTDPPPPAEQARERIETETSDAGDMERAVAAAGEKQGQSGEPVPSAPRKTSPFPGESARISRPPAGGKALASPAVRARAASLGIDLSAVAAGADGVVRHADLDAVLTRKAPALADDAELKAASVRNSPDDIPGAGERVKVIGLRRRIAENMAASKRHIPHFSYVEECDVTALDELRARFNEMSGEAGARPRLTLLPFLMTAICQALPGFPMINARYDDEAGVVTRYDSVHLGMATQTDSGLMVPVIRDARRLGLWELASEISRLARAARDGSAKSDELSGSTLTITSLGPLGGVATTPVINRPEVAIIGPNRIIERPVFVPDGAGGERLEKRKLMNLSISCDHRVVDGWDAANFVQAVKRLIETPILMLAG